MRRGLIGCALLASCGPAGIVRVEVPAYEGTRVIVVGEREAVPARIWVAGPDSPIDALPVSEITEGEDLVVTVLELPDGADVPLGEHEVGGDPPLMALPAPVRARGTEVTVNDTGAAWRALPVVPPAMLGLRIHVPCPVSSEEIGSRPINIPQGCPLPGPERPRICYGTLRRVPAFDDPSGPLPPRSHDAPSSVAIENGENWLYFSTDRLVPIPGGSFTQAARMKLITASTPDLGTLEVLPVTPPPEEHRLGWTAGIKVRRDGLEMFAHSSLFDASYWDDDIYHAWRSSVSEPWSLAKAGFVTSLSNLDNGMDPTHMSDADEKEHPTLLPDYRTLIFVERTIYLVSVARRQTARPSDLEFEKLEPVSLDTEFSQIKHFTLSCDQRHVIYMRERPNDAPSPGGPDKIREPRIAKILSLDPLAFGPPETIAIAGATRESPFGFPLSQAKGSQQIYLAETPDCQALYVTPDFHPYVADRVPCD